MGCVLHTPTFRRIKNDESAVVMRAICSGVNTGAEDVRWVNIEFRFRPHYENKIVPHALWYFIIPEKKLMPYAFSHFITPELYKIQYMNGKCIYIHMDGNLNCCINLSSMCIWMCSKRMILSMIICREFLTNTFYFRFRIYNQIYCFLLWNVITLL